MMSCLTRVIIESNRRKDDLNLHCDQGAYGVWYFDDVPEVGRIRCMVQDVLKSSKLTNYKI